MTQKADRISVIIATFNSSTLLPRVLESIRGQKYPQDCVEILIVDGGSTDNTRRIAERFGCRIIANSKVEPLYAKYLGYKHAKGRYIIYLDHDEIILNKKSFSRRVGMFKDNPQVKAAIGNGYQTPPGYGIINRYINEFGDPFSFFIYRLSKYDTQFIPRMRDQYSVAAETSQYIVFDVGASQRIPLIELAAGGGMIDSYFFKKMFPQIIKQYYLIPHLLYLLKDRFPLLAIMKNDALRHYAPDDLKGYVQKIIWRIKNNIFYTDSIGASGFTGREEYSSAILQTKKFLFLPYALTLLLPLLDSFYLMITRKNISYIAHFPLTVMTAVFICFYSAMKVIGRKPLLRSYDGTTFAYEKDA